MTEKTRQPLQFVYVLNILSCFAVVILHVSLDVFSPAAGLGWVRAVILQAVGIFAVPVFFMISGMNLLGYRSKYDTDTFFRRRFLRVGRSLILASLFCYCLLCLFPHSFYGAEGFSGVFGPLDFIRRFFSNSINDVYWFLYGIVYLYLLTPLLSLCASRRRLMRYLIVVTGVASVLFPLAVRFGVPSSSIQTTLNWPFFASISMLYFLLGYYVGHMVDNWNGSDSRRVPAWVWAVVFVMSAAGMVLLGLYTNGFFSGALSAQYHEYVISIASPLCVVEAVSLFMLCKGLESRLRRLGQRSRSVLRTLSGASLGVYLFHILIINWAGANLHGGALTVWNAHPVMRAVVVYVLTAAVVMASKALIALVKSRIAGRGAEHAAPRP